MKYIGYRIPDTSADNWIILWTPHSWYKLTSPESVVIGVYFKNLHIEMQGIWELEYDLEDNSD